MTARRCGAFTKTEALAAGYSARQIRSRVARREWVALRDGVYVDAARCRALAADPDSLHCLDVEAVALATEGAVISHGSAVRRYGMDHLVDVGTRLHATWPRDSHRSTWVEDEIDVHRARLPPSHVVCVGGVDFTTPARTVADVSRNQTFPGAVVVGDSALAKRLTTRAEIKDAVDAMKGWPGVQQARQVVKCLDARVQSPLESLCHAVFSLGGLPRPELQVWVYDEYGFAGIVDGIWLDPLVAYEADGLVKYTRFGEADTLRREKSRQERIEAAGLPVRRFGWDDVQKHRERSLSRVTAAFREARRRQRPRVRLYVGDRDTPAPDPTQLRPGDSPASLGLRIAYDGLAFAGQRVARAPKLS